MRTFLKILGFLVVIVATAAIALGILIYNSQKKKCAEAQVAQDGFPISQLNLSHIRASGTDIQGRINNRSSQQIYGFLIEVIVEDCVGNSCVAVGNHQYRVESSVPPGEARDFFKQDLVGNQLATIQPRGEVRVSTKIVRPILASEYVLLDCAGRF